MLSEFWGYLPLFILGIWDIFQNNPRDMGYSDPLSGVSILHASWYTCVEYLDPPKQTSVLHGHKGTNIKDRLYHDVVHIKNKWFIFSEHDILFSIVFPKLIFLINDISYEIVILNLIIFHGITVIKP